MKCGCKAVYVTDRRVDGVTIDDALSIGCTCCNVPSGMACGGSGQLEPNAKRGAVRWADVCPTRVALFVNQGTQAVLL